MGKGTHSIGKTHQKIFGPTLRPLVIILPVSSGSATSSSGGAGVGVALLMGQ